MKHHLSAVIAVLIALVSSAPTSFAVTKTWTGTTSADWNTAANWSPSGVPILTGDPLFNISTNLTVTVSGSNSPVRHITFDGGTGSFTIGATGAGSLLVSNNAIATLSVNATGSNLTETINAPLTLLSGNSTSAGTHTFTNLNVTASNIMVLGGAISSGTTTSTETLTLTGVNTGNNAVNGVISDGLAAGGLSISKTSTGKWILGNSSNSFTGGVQIGAGTVSVASIGNSGSASALGTNGTIKIGSGTTNGGTLVYTGATGETTDKVINLAATTAGGAVLDQSGDSGVLMFTADMTNASTSSKTVTLQGSNTGTGEFAGKIVNGAAGGTVNVLKLGSNTWVLSGANTYNGTTTVSAGRLVAGANAPSGSIGAFGNAASALVLGNVSTGASDAPSLLINGAHTVARNISVGSATNTAAYNATIGGSNTSGTSTYNGSITLSTKATAYTTTLQAAAGGSVEFKTGTWTTNNKTVTIGSTGNTGTVKLSNNLVTTGGVSINYGTLLLGAGNALGDASTPVTVSGGTLDVSGLSDTVNSLTLISGSVNGTSGIITASAAYDMRGGSVSAILAGSVALNKTTGSTVTLSGANTYTGATTVSAGTLEVTGNLTATTHVTVTGGSLLIGSSNVINDTATVSMGGGSIAMGSAGNLTESVGQLTLSSNSTLDFGSGANNVMRFASFDSSGSAIFTISNWLPTTHLVFTSSTGGQTEWDRFSFGSGIGTTQIAYTGAGGGFEIIAVPEPGTIAAGLTILGFVAWRERKRLASLVRTGRNIVGGPERIIL